MAVILPVQKADTTSVGKCSVCLSCSICCVERKIGPSKERPVPAMTAGCVLIPGPIDDALHDWSSFNCFQTAALLVNRGNALQSPVEIKVARVKHLHHPAPVGCHLSPSVLAKPC